MNGWARVLTIWMRSVLASSRRFSRTGAFLSVKAVTAGCAPERDLTS